MKSAEFSTKTATKDVLDDFLERLARRVRRFPNVKRVEKQVEIIEVEGQKSFREGRLVVQTNDKTAGDGVVFWGKTLFFAVSENEVEFTRSVESLLGANIDMIRKKLEASA